VPVISTFYGILVYMYTFDAFRHHRPHIHVKYGEFSAGFTIDEADLLYGYLPKAKMRLVQAWIEIHREELMDDWNLAVNGTTPFKIEPLK
jgi:hypothetical protein